MLSLLIIDLDGFKAVNDTYGHQIGDHFLTHLGGLLEASTRDVGLVSRVGGDEFYIYLVDLTESEVRDFIHTLQMTLNQNPYQTSDVSIPIRASIGVSHAPDQGTNLDTLIHKADQAMYQIKQDGKNDYAIYDEALHGPK
jgi:diguanylate cyclase (GGDEF)-like protein